MLARLPEKLVKHNHIHEMMVGQSGFTVPWAMSINKQRLCSLRPDYTFYDKPGGTVSLWIQKTPTGYRVFPDPSDHYTWDPEGENHTGLPVCEVLDHDYQKGDWPPGDVSRSILELFFGTRQP